MTERRDNYKIQMEQAQKLFLTYDQQELIKRCRLAHDTDFLYFRFLMSDYRLQRHTGDLQRLRDGQWTDGNSFGEVMTVLDWICDSRADRYITDRWVNMVSLGHSFHTQLQEDGEDPYAKCFDAAPEAFAAACEALGGIPGPGGDVSYSLELLDDLRVLVQLWHGDEEFAPRLRLLWDENTTRYIRYETTWYAVPLLLRKIRDKMYETG